jgi:hypothetical protein
VVAGIVSAATSASAAPMPFYTDSTAVSGFGPMATPNANLWGGSDKTRSSVIFEAFIDYTPAVAAVTDPITVFENGADAIGSGVAIHGDDIIFAAGGSSVANTAVAAGAHGLTAGQAGVQIVAALEFNAGAGAANELLSLYVNGLQVATADHATGNDWAGVNTSNLGASDSFLIFEYVPSINPNAGDGANGKYTGDYPDQTATITFAAYELGVGDNTVENILVSPPAPDTFPLTITPAVSGFDLSWPSEAGMLYRVLSNTGLGTPIDTWTLVEGDIAATPDTNTYNVNPADPMLFYAVEEYPAPPVTLLNETFEAGDGGFTTLNKGTGTDWAWGAPATPDQGGGGVMSGNGGSTNCWAANLTGGYAADTDACLRSGVIDLTAVAAASLSFAWSIDAAPGHTYQVNVIAAGSDTVIANVIPATGDADPLSSAWATVGPTAIPVAALGQQVRLEWRFTGDGAGDYNGAYLDDVVVTTP